MKVAVVGSRDFVDFDYLSKVLDLFVKKFNITKIISGGARGTDRMAIKYAKKNKMAWGERLPNVKRDGYPAALFIRNQRIVDDSEMMIAFWNGTSTGTLDAMEKADKKGIVIHLIEVGV